MGLSWLVVDLGKLLHGNLLRWAMDIAEIDVLGSERASWGLLEGQMCTWALELKIQSEI